MKQASRRRSIPTYWIAPELPHGPETGSLPRATVRITWRTLTLPLQAAPTSRGSGLQKHPRGLRHVARVRTQDPGLENLISTLVSTTHLVGGLGNNKRSTALIEHQLYEPCSGCRGQSHFIGSRDPEKSSGWLWGTQPRKAGTRFVGRRPAQQGPQPW